MIVSIVRSVPFGFMVALITVTSLAESGDSAGVKEIRYEGISPSAPDGRCGLPNPERGFRHEARIGHRPGSTMWGVGAYLKDRATKGFSDDWLLMNARRYNSHGITLAQTYCYLDDFVDQPISEEKLALLRRSLSRCREAGLKVLLRFAYEKDMKQESGPTVETILGHIEQLAPVIQANTDIIYVLQAGFVGAWGEWHSSAHHIEEDHSALAAIVARELDLLTEDRMIQLRVLPKYKRWVLEDPILNAFIEVDETNAFSGIPAARIGLANDGLLANQADGGTWVEPPHYANPGNPEFDAFTRESPYLAVDGELYWSDQGGEIDGMRAAKRLRLHHHTSLSITHSYSGYEDTQFSIDRWMETPITVEELRREKLPVSDRYFEDWTGRPLPRTQFEYIRDHLGYRIELQLARFPGTVVQGDKPFVEMELINRGFATLINPRPVYLTLINTSGELVQRQQTAANPQTWQPFQPGDSEHTPLRHHVHGELRTAGLAPGEYMLGLWLPDASARIAEDARYAVRVANGDVPWWTTAAGKFGINILGAIEIQDRHE